MGNMRLHPKSEGRLSLLLATNNINMPRGSITNKPVRQDLKSAAVKAWASRPSVHINNRIVEACSLDALRSSKGTHARAHETSLLRCPTLIINREVLGGK